MIFDLIKCGKNPIDITIRDSVTGETLFYMNGILTTINCTTDFNGNKANLEVKELTGHGKAVYIPKVEAKECDHEWVTYHGLVHTDTTCKKCGKNK